jgi:DNA repair protein RecN (Recombination protein N)
MLSTLSIRDVVLIDRLELSFAPGLCALTGETGAGKSILLDALGLALGGRADSRLVRHGCETASVAAGFAVAADHPVHGLMREHDLPVETDGLVLRRVLGRDGRSRAFVNDHSVGVSMLRRLGELLVEVHGQFESQRLLEPATHRTLLDTFAGALPQLAECARSWDAWRETLDRLAQAEAEIETARRDEDYLRHVLGELDALDPQPGEEDDLATRRSRMQNAEKQAAAVAEAAEVLSGQGRGPMGALQGALRILQRNADGAHGRVAAVIESLDRAASELAEAEALLEAALAEAEHDPRALESIEERLFALRRAARKHDVHVDDLAGLRTQLGERLASVEAGDERVVRLRAAAEAAGAGFRQAAADVGAARRQARGRLDSAVAAELAPLRLGGARFATRIDELPERDWGRHGRDRVEFEVATNPGVPPGPLGRIASGGELARLMLALKVVLAGADPVPTLVFDEVDAGIGGAVAAAVGERLARLSREVQVLVVTHSPQVAARGQHHWRIAKTEADGAARTAVDALGAAERAEEIARMLAGTQVTDAARAAALSLLRGSAA